MNTSAFLRYNYPTDSHNNVRHLCLRIFKRRQFPFGLFGAFIDLLFPEVRSLELRYDSVTVCSGRPDSQPCFPFWLGSLTHLEALGYGWLSQGSGSALMRVDPPRSPTFPSFPALRSVATDLGFELDIVTPAETTTEDRLEFLTVQRLQLRLSGAATLTENELRRHAAKLHGLHPHVTCLAFDLEQAHPNSKAKIVRSIEILAREFCGFEELEILGCDAQVGELLRELIAEANADAALQLVRQLKVKLGADVARTAPETDRVAALNSVRMSLGSFPRLECAEVDGVFLAVQCEVNKSCQLN